MSSSNLSDYPRTATGFDAVDPVTLTQVDVADQYYIRENTTRRKEIRHVYHKATLERILDGQRSALSPITRKPFTKHDIVRAPAAGRIHPELEGKKIQVVLKTRDTKEHVGPRLKEGQRADILMRERENSLTIKKMSRFGGMRRYRVNVTLSVEAKGDEGLSRILDAISDVVQCSNSIIHVDSSRVVRETSS